VSPGDVAERIASVGLVPVLVLESADLAVPVCEALLAGGVSTAEVTFRTPDAAEAIARIREALPQMLVGAGTLLSEVDVRRAHDAGAAFGVAPGLREAVVRTAQDVGLPFFPGVCTPGDIERGLALGLDVLKFFPAGSFGGPGTLAALLGAYRHTGVRFMPTGGVTLENAGAYWSIPEVLAVGATALAPADLQRAGRWAEITARAEAFCAAFRVARPAIASIITTTEGNGS
jgi:2-dehydro-3-deoxyphosphogluconate aldolase/(4S)-4-hydroxy-2-oxoglutarate aldolase